MRFDLNAAITHLGEALNLPDLQLNDDGFACIASDDFEVCLLAQPADDTLLLFSRVGPLPETPDAALMQRLLEGNLLTRETAGATLGIDPDQGWIVLSRVIDPATWDLARFEGTVVDFLEVVGYWVMKIQDHLEGLLDDDGAATPAALATRSAPALGRTIRG